MNVLSLFDGISCGRIALERAGIKVDKYYASEICEYSIRIAKRNWRNIIEIGDIRAVCGTDYSNIDLLIGGSPCQQFSLCGKAKGAITKEQIKVISLEQYLQLKEDGFEFEGQSYLFWEYARVLKETNPKYFLLENVPMKKEWEDVITNTLGVSPIKINSANFSAQVRERLYWTNIPVEKFVKETNSSVLQDILTPAENVEDKYWYRCDFDFDTLDKAVCARLYLNGHDFLKRVMSPKFKCHTLTAVCGGNQQKKVYQDGRCRKLTPLEYERLQTLPDGYTEGESDGNRYKVIGNGWTVNVIAHIFSFLPNEYKIKE